MSLSKPTPCLSGMPCLVKEKIITKLDLVTRLSLRRCSKELHKISNTSKMQYHNVNFQLIPQAIRLEVSKMPIRYASFDALAAKPCEIVFWVDYRSNGADCLVQSRRRTDLVCGINYMDLAVSELIKIIGNPKGHVENLVIFSSWREIPELQESEEFVKKLSETFSNFNASLNIQYFAMVDPLDSRDMKIMLEALKPGKLRKLRLKLKESTQNMNEITAMEQFKQVKGLNVFGWDNIETQSVAGIPKVSIVSMETSMSLEAFNGLIRGILRQGDTFKEFYLNFMSNTDDDELAMYIRFLQQIPNATNGIHEREKFIQLPNADWKVQIYVWPYGTLNITNVPLDFQSDF